MLLLRLAGWLWLGSGRAAVAGAVCGRSVGRSLRVGRRAGRRGVPGAAAGGRRAVGVSGFQLA